MTNLNLLVLSDLHCFSKLNNQVGTGFDIDRSEDALHPFRNMVDVIKSDGQKIDHIICCGDICDKADPEAIKYAWRNLNEIKLQLEAKRVLITTGNHDVDSRYTYNAKNPVECLRSLTPNYPIIETAQSDAYWSRNYYVLIEDSVRYVVVNTAALHGLGKDEWKHGRVELRLIKDVLKEMESQKGIFHNILIIHHHPQKLPEYQDVEDFEIIENGQELLHQLSNAIHGEWLVIHGHKHLPGLTYACGGSLGSPMLFSAGSFSGPLYQVHQKKTAHQFYCISLELNSYVQAGYVGTFKTWEYSMLNGWRPASSGSGMPSVGGFGLRSNISRLSKEVVDALNGETIYWRDFLIRVPHIRYLIPDDLNALRSYLSKYHNVNILFDDASGLPIQIGSKS